VSSSVAVVEALAWVKSIYIYNKIQNHDLKPEKNAKI